MSQLHKLLSSSSGRAAHVCCPSHICILTLDLNIFIFLYILFVFLFLFHLPASLSYAHTRPHNLMPLLPRVFHTGAPFIDPMAQ